MYVDGVVLFIIYAMAAIALLISVHNHLEYKEIIKRLNRPTKRPPPHYTPPVVTKNKSKGPWS